MQKFFKVTDFKAVAAEKADIVALLVAYNEFKALRFSEGQVILNYCEITNK